MDADVSPDSAVTGKVNKSVRSLDEKLVAGETVYGTDSLSILLNICSHSLSRSEHWIRRKHRYANGSSDIPSARPFTTSERRCAHQKRH